jgi:hypothetical protein
MFPVNISLLKDEQRSAHYFSKAASSDFAGFEKFLANSKDFGTKNLLIHLKLKAQLKKI